MKKNVNSKNALQLLCESYEEMQIQGEVGGILYDHGEPDTHFPDLVLRNFGRVPCSAIHH